MALDTETSAASQAAGSAVSRADEVLTPEAMAFLAPLHRRFDARIAQRAGLSPEESYTAKLLAKGVAKCAQKLGEEAVETVIAAVENDRDHLIAESADLLFHLLVLLKSRDVRFEEVEAALEQRTGTSGLEEKAARKRDT